MSRYQYIPFMSCSRGGDLETEKWALSEQGTFLEPYETLRLDKAITLSSMS